MMACESDYRVQHGMQLGLDNALVQTEGPAACERLMAALPDAGGEMFQITDLQVISILLVTLIRMCFV